MPGLPSGAQRASITSGIARNPIARAAILAFLAVLVTLIAAPDLFAATPIATKSAASTSSTTTSVTTSTVPATWLSDELFYLSLVNCTRTGGWVSIDGTCSRYDSGHYSAYVRPLTRYIRLSDLVTRPYARLLAIRNACSHTLDGDIAYRLHRAGYPLTTWGENIGCYSGYPTVRAAIIAAHRAMQAEKSWNGPHWRNIKSATFTVIGIGIWKYYSRVRVVSDFYRG